MVNDHFNFEEKRNEFREDSEDQNLEEKLVINMLAANDVNLRILTYTSLKKINMKEKHEEFLLQLFVFACD